MRGGPSTERITWKLASSSQAPWDRHGSRPPTSWLHPPYWGQATSSLSR